MSIGEAPTDEIAIKPRPRGGDDSEMDITPMIDITFLLLIFFLVASKMDEPAPIVLPEARNGGAVATKNAIVLTLKQGTGLEARIYKGDGGDESKLLKAKDPLEQENEVVAYIEALIVEDPTKSQVVIKAERQVRNKEVGRVAKAVGRVNEIQGLHVAVLEVQ